MLPTLIYFLIALYGFSEILTLVATKSTFRKSPKDVTFYAITLPVMASYITPYFEYRYLWKSCNTGLLIAGLALFALGFFLRIKGIVDLRGFFSNVVEKSEGHTLITTGVYSVIRHPLYLGNLLLSLSVSLMYSAKFSYVLVLAGCIGTILRIAKEERFMLKEFPDYPCYIKKTCRLLPKVY